MDHYLDYDNVYSRLYNEWLTHGKLIIAYDFDNTVHDFHDAGHTYNNVIGLLRRCKYIGAHFIVFTANPDTYFVRKYLSEHQIPFDTVNQNLPFIDSKGVKPYYNILLDDRAGLESAYEVLNNLCMYLERTGKIRGGIRI